VGPRVSQEAAEKIKFPTSVGTRTSDHSVRGPTIYQLANVEDMVSYSTDAYGAHCEHTRSTVVRTHQRVILAICAQR
jgi:hypothetical protein